MECFMWNIPSIFSIESQCPFTIFFSLDFTYTHHKETVNGLYVLEFYSHNPIFMWDKLIGDGHKAMFYEPKIDNKEQIVKEVCCINLYFQQNNVIALLNSLLILSKIIEFYIYSKMVFTHARSEISQELLGTLVEHDLKQHFNHGQRICVNGLTKWVMPIPFRTASWSQTFFYYWLRNCLNLLPKWFYAYCDTIFLTSN